MSRPKIQPTTRAQCKHQRSVIPRGPEPRMHGLERLSKPWVEGGMPLSKPTLRLQLSRPFLPAAVPAANHSMHPSSSSPTSSPNQHGRSCPRSCAASNGGADSADHHKKQWLLSGHHNCVARGGKLVDILDR
ncbi:hypothetical protein Nepgr_003013 [Nepenthes gracilis]|uniref:Uncharacterized protein n=1 Tax=Nepenthes gracilis TaxID=150966 RepID=A0AAD3RYV2_NEPGR|nr:hypothetical protein Nepgr_003013 [Nepenthes gracilis]